MTAAAPAPPAAAPVGDGSTRAQRTLGGLAWSSAGYGAQAVGQLVLLAVLARLLTPADFGVVTSSLVIVGFGRLLTQSVVSATVVQRPVLDDDHIRAAYWLSVATGLLTAGALVAVAPVAATWFAMPDVATLTRALAAVFVVQSASMVAGALLERSLDFRTVAMVDVVSFTVGFVGVGVALGVAGAGMWALVGAHAAQSVLQAVLLVRARPHPKSLRFPLHAAGELTFVGSGFATARIFNFAALQGDNVVVARTLQATALGVYGRAYQLLAMPAMLFGQVVDRVLFPVLADIQFDRDRLAATYSRAVGLIVAVMAPLSVMLAALAPEVVEILLGDRWGDVVTPLRVLTIGLVARTAYKASDTLAKAVGRPYARARRQFVYAVLVIGGSALGQRHGVTGVAAAVTVAIVANHVLMAQLCLAHLGLTWRRFATAHVGALGPAVVLAASTVPLTALLRAAAAPAAVILLVGVVAGATAVGLLWRWAPRAVVTDDVAWLHAELRGWLRR